MEQSRHERGGQIRLIAYGAGVLCLAAVAKVGVLILSKNKRTPQQRGGWEYIDYTDEAGAQIESMTTEETS